MRAGRKPIARPDVQTAATASQTATAAPETAKPVTIAALAEGEGPAEAKAEPLEAKPADSKLADAKPQRPRSRRLRRSRASAASPGASRSS
ncbi:hypothetical protein [Hankyongella ginsenosidimutans]|uniref:hypothetical protein n=1 Tax=Hankyongella ginsenosidimutans TaxID=1763828 RepID=UPI001FE5FFB7|nr:hypothetical protein [Hankyongella ginsenosidimutans]